MDRPDYRASLDREIDAFVGALHGDPRRPVPSCPGWDVQELVWHLGEVQASWARNLRARGEPPTAPIARPEAVTIEWYRKQADDLLAALDASQPGDPCWNWTGTDFTAAWVLRRQAQEAAVHRWDAEAVAGDPMAIDLDLAVDGIDEMVDVFLPAGIRFGEIEPPTGGSWRIEVADAPGAGWSIDAPADAVTSGNASDVLLAMWGRMRFDSVTTTGDRAVLEWWRGLPIF